MLQLYFQLQIFYFQTCQSLFHGVFVIIRKKCSAPIFYCKILGLNFGTSELPDPTALGIEPVCKHRCSKLKFEKKRSVDCYLKIEDEKLRYLFLDQVLRFFDLFFPLRF